jgi:hypothetical protein
MLLLAKVDEQRNCSWVKAFFFGEGIGVGWIIASSLRNSQLREDFLH